MKIKNERVWFITGASRGLGRALVRAVLENGDKVVAASRKATDSYDLVEKFDGMILPVNLDVTDSQQVQLAVTKAIKYFGRIDVLVNNAGYGLFGAIEEVSEEEVRQLFDVNVFGLLAVTRAILPIMRHQKSGHILNLSSVAGISAGVGSGIYAASKFAVEGLSEALAAEIEPLNIKVTIVEPGQFRTNFLGSSLRTANKRLEDYRATAGFMQESLSQQNGLQKGDPAKAAEAMIKIVEVENPTLRLPLGHDCIVRIKKKLESVQTDITICEEFALSTNFR